MSALGVRLSGDLIGGPDERGDLVMGDTVLLLMNAHYEAIPFMLRPLKKGQRWERVLDTAPEPLPFEGEPLYELQGRSMAVLHTTPQYNQTWRPLGITTSSPQENIMLREKTKNFKQLCDDPHVRQPRRLLWALKCSRGGASIFGWGLTTPAGRSRARRRPWRGSWGGAAGRRINARGVWVFLRAGRGRGRRYALPLPARWRGRVISGPASRFQPCGPHGPSQVIDPDIFDWHDSQWHGVPLVGQVIYEMHLGTFTSEGTWEAASRELPELAKVGITVIEIMPIADFPGRFGWGYDGVNLFAPTRLYGTPDDCRRFVDRAHALGLGVILDVVYNHLGPDGNYLVRFSPEYFSSRYTTDWGEAINFDDEHAGPVREFFLANAAYWIDEFHLDGLRLDATQNIYDSSSDHILAAVARAVRQAAHGRATLLIAENEPQQTHLVRPPAQGGYGLDALWNDDFHHSAMVA